MYLPKLIFNGVYNIGNVGKLGMFTVFESRYIYILKNKPVEISAKCGV